MFKEFEVNGKIYKLRLSTRECINLEKRIGGNPLDTLMLVESGKLPSINFAVEVLHAALQKYHHGITLDNVYDLYDEYIEHGGTFVDFIEVITDIFKVSGFFK